MPPGSGMPVPTPVIETPSEEVPADLVGVINGQRVYRGQATYVFEKASESKVVRKAVPNKVGATARAPVPSGAPAAGAQPPATAKTLPTTVGSPAAKK